MRPEIISSLIMGGSEGGGGQTIDSIISSVERKMPARSGTSTRDDLIRVIVQTVNILISI